MVAAIGIDIGGTQLRIGVIDASGQAHVFFRGSSFSKQDPERLIDAIVTALEDPRILSQRSAHQIMGVGIGMAGLVSSSDGRVCASPHFPNLRDYPLLSRLQERVSLPIVIDNDANCLAYGEAWQGAAKEWSDFILVAIGTGIGGGMVRHGKIEWGTSGFAGEIGHICVDINGPSCACGSRGCWETIASGSGLPNLVTCVDPHGVLATLNPDQLGRELFGLAQLGDPVALAVYRKLGEHLAIGIAALISVTGIEKFILAGGLYEAADFFMPALREALPKWTYLKPYLPHLQLLGSTLVPWGGVYGAARLALDHVRLSQSNNR